MRSRLAVHLPGARRPGPLLSDTCLARVEAGPETLGDVHVGRLKGVIGIALTGIALFGAALCRTPPVITEDQVFRLTRQRGVVTFVSEPDEIGATEAEDADNPVRTRTPDRREVTMPLTDPVSVAGIPSIQCLTWW